MSLWIRSLALAVVVFGTLACGADDKPPPELFLPTSVTWTVEKPWVVQGDDARLTVSLTWDRPIPAGVLVQLPEEEGCYFEDCSVAWDGPARTRATVMVKTNPVPKYDDSSAYRFAEAKAAGVVRVCTVATPRRCVQTEGPEQSVHVLHSAADYVAFPEDEITLAVGERRSMQAIAQTFSTRYGRAPSRLVYSPAEVTYDNLADGIVRVDEAGVFEAIVAPGSGIVRAYAGGKSAELRVKTVPADALRALPPNGYHPFPPRALPRRPLSASSSLHQKFIDFDRQGSPLVLLTQDRVSDGDDTWTDSFAPIALRRWTGSGWSHEIVTGYEDTPLHAFVVVGGDDRIYIGFATVAGVMSVRNRLTLLDRPVDAPPTTPWRRRTWSVEVAGHGGPVHTRPEFAAMPAPDGVWIAAHMAIGTEVKDEADAQTMMAAGLRSNCFRTLQVARVTEAGIAPEPVETESLVPSSMKDGVKFDFDCEKLIDGLGDGHNTSAVWMGPADEGLGARPILVTERFGLVNGGGFLGFLEVYLKVGLSQYRKGELSPEALALMQVHRVVDGAWQRAPAVSDAGNLARFAARALTWSPGVPLDDPLWDDGNWASFASSRLRPGASIPEQGAWLLDASAHVPVILRHILPWRGEVKDSLMSRTSDREWTPGDVHPPGGDSWASFVGGHGSLAMMNQEGGFDDQGLWFQRADLRLPRPDSPLSEGRQPLPRGEVVVPDPYFQTVLYDGGSMPPVYTQAVALSGGRVALLGPSASQKVNRDLVQIVGTSGLTPPWGSGCLRKEGYLLGGGPTLRVLCVPETASMARLMELDEASGTYSERAMAALSDQPAGTVLAVKTSADGTPWVLYGVGSGPTPGTSLVRFIPNASGYDREITSIPPELSPAVDRTTTSWGLWNDGDGMTIVHRTKPIGSRTSTIASWQWTPGGGFETPRTTTLELPRGDEAVDVGRGAIVGSRALLTTSVGPYISADGGPYVPVSSPEPFGKPIMGIPIFGERIEGVFPMPGAGVGWVESVVESPGTAYAAVRTSTDGVTWSAPRRVLDTRSGFQVPWAAATATDGDVVFYVGDSHSFGVRYPTDYLLGMRDSNSGYHYPFLLGTVVRLKP